MATDPPGPQPRSRFNVRATSSHTKEGSRGVPGLLHERPRQLGGRCQYAEMGRLSEVQPRRSEGIQQRPHRLDHARLLGPQQHAATSDHLWASVVSVSACRTIVQQHRHRAPQLERERNIFRFTLSKVNAELHHSLLVRDPSPLDPGCALDCRRSAQVPRGDDDLTPDRSRHIQFAKDGTQQIEEPDLREESERAAITDRRHRTSQPARRSPRSRPPPTFSPPRHGARWLIPAARHRRSPALARSLRRHQIQHSPPREREAEPSPSGRANRSTSVLRSCRLALKRQVG